MTEEKRSEYMKRLKNEYERFRSDMYLRAPSDIFDSAQDIVNMRYAYDYLRSSDISDEELDYIMQAKKPIYEMAQTRQAMDEVSYFDNPMAATVFDICDKDLFCDEEIEKYTDRIPIRFHRKVSTFEEIEGFSRIGGDDKFKVEKVIELPRASFEWFLLSMLDDYPIIAENKELMWFDKNTECWHCLLIKDAVSDRGVLVESEGYDYARYSAYVQNVREIDMENVPVQKLSDYAHKQRKAATRQER